MILKRTVKRTMIARALSIAFMSSAVVVATTPSAYAQSADGAIYGRGKSGAQVTMTNTETGATRQLTVDSNGAFVVSKVQPGSYKLVSNGVTREITVSIGSEARVSFDESVTQRVEISGTNRRSAIDVGSTENNTVFTQAQLQALPIPRDISAVAALAPGVVRGDRDFADDGEKAGSLPSFGGASVAENGYYINGFDVTNIRNFLSYAAIPFDAIAEQQIKMGGYSAEYGRSLGGVVSLLTKRGTNTWKGGVSVYWEPESLHAKGTNVKDKEPTRPGNYTVFERDDKASSLNTTAYIGGPLIENKLFMFMLVEGKDERTTNFGNSLGTVERSVRPNGMLKVDFTPHENHHFEYTGIQNKKEVRINDYTNATPYSTNLDGSAVNSKRSSGGTVHIGKYTGNLTDNLTVSALVGSVEHLRSKTTGARTLGLDCPVVLDETLAEVGCWAGPFPGVGAKDALAPEDKDRRDAWRLDVDYVLGNHTLRAGLDHQKFKTSEAGGSSYTGGFYYRYFTVGAGGSVNGVAVAPGTPYVRQRLLQSTTGSYSVENKAYYIEDTWRGVKDVTLNAGLRWETFDNKNGDNVSFVKSDALLAPRFGAAWDVNSDASLKIYGSAGRYFIPVASNSNVRMTRGEQFVTKYFTYAGKDPRTQGPLGFGAATQIGGNVVSGDGTLPEPGSVADTKLKPMSQDEFILGFQKAIAPGWVAGVKYVNRKVNNGMDDWCDGDAIDTWAAANGYALPTLGYHCALVNPGQPVTLKLDWDGTGVLREVAVPASVTGLAKYQRKYDALEFTLEKAFDGKWGMQASYTYSKSRGTAEGYVNSIINQDDAGVTQEFDYGSFTHGADGYLPNDRRHQFKIFGNYAITEEYRIGANVSIASGRPRSCIGFVPSTVADYAGSSAYGTASSFYCVNDAGNTVLVQRGSVGRTPWVGSLDLQFAYLPKMANKQKLTLQVDVFNVFNSQKAVEVDEIQDFSRATSGGAAGTGQQSLNYGSPSSFQTPRYVRLSARWEF